MNISAVLAALLLLLVCNVPVMSAIDSIPSVANTPTVAGICVAVACLDIP